MQAPPRPAAAAAAPPLGAVAAARIRAIRGGTERLCDACETLARMPFHPIADVARLTVRVQGPQLQVMTIGTYWTLATPAPMSPTDVAGLAGDADVTFASTLLTTRLNDHLTYLGVEARALDTLTSPVALASSNAGVGHISDTLLPIETCACISFHSGVPGRSNRNRCYWFTAGLNDMDTGGSQGLFKSGYASGLTTDFGAWISAMTTGGTFVQVIASPKLGTHEPILTTTVSQRPASQRRREP